MQNYGKNGDKIVRSLIISDLHFISAEAGLRLSTVYLCFTSSHFCTVCEFGMKARGYAYVFPCKRQQLVLIFSAKGGKMPFKKHQILMSAVTFSANGP